MVKRISLRNLNYITAILGLLLSVHSTHAEPQIKWRHNGGILRPQGDDTVDTFVPVCLNNEENPIAIVKMLDLKAGIFIVETPPYQSLQEPLREWLQRLGVIDDTGLSTRKVSVAYVIHHPINDAGAPVIWRYTGSTGASTMAAIKLLPLTNGQISFDLAADQRAGILIPSLPNNFLLRQLPYAQGNDAWWRVKIAENDPGQPFAFAAIVMLPNGDMAITVEIIPQTGFAANDPNTIELLFQHVSHADHSCLVPFKYDPDTAVESYRSAVESNDAVALQRLLSNASDAQRKTLLHTHSRDDWTALHLAAAKGYTAVVRALLSDPVPSDQRTAQLQAKNKDGWTALHLAAEKGHTTIAQLLIEKGADVNAKTSDTHGQFTPLHIAAAKGYTAVVQALLSDSVPSDQRTAQLQAKNKDGWTPLHLVIYLKSSANDADGSGRQQIGGDITRALLEKLRAQGKNIVEILVNDTFKRAGQLRRWETIVQKPENAWYKQALQNYGVDVNALLAE
jgi:ankyrin repeat protein